MHTHENAFVYLVPDTEQSGVEPTRPTSPHTRLVALHLRVVRYESIDVGCMGAMEAVRESKQISLSQFSFRLVSKDRRMWGRRVGEQISVKWKECGSIFH